MGRGPGPGLFWAFLVVEAGHLACVLLAPPEKTLGLSQKVFYYHLPCAIGCFLCYFVALCLGAVHLATRRAKFDRASAAAVDVGLILNALTLATGSLWARNDWGVWWEWRDMRLVTTLVMAFLYLGYFWLRRALPPGDRRALACSVYAILAFANVPLVYFALKLFPSPSALHPPGIEYSHPLMRASLLTGLAAILLLLPYLVGKRAHVLALEERLAEVRALREAREAGALG